MLGAMVKPEIEPNAARASALAALIWCARAQVGPSQADFPAPATDHGWAELLRLALEHGLLPVAAARLAGQAGVPADLARDLALGSAMTARRNLELAGELIRILGWLADEGIVGVPWKGPLLAQQAYGQIGLRSFFDLDVLVRRGDLSAARDVLLGRGFRTEKAMTAVQQRRYVDQQGELEFVREADGLWLELHTAVVPTYYAAGRNVDDLWLRLRAARLARAEVWSLALSDDLEALCVHGSKHRWDRLAWVLDVALVAARLDEDGWRDLLERSARHGTLRMVSLGVVLAVDLCAARLPDDVVQRARRDRTAVMLAAEVIGQLQRPTPSRTDALLFHARMRERSRDRARYLLSVLTTPSGADWGALPLPQALFPLYAVTRPIRLGLKYGRRILG